MIITKLARDRIVELVENKKVNATLYVADQTEFVQRLREKLQEEVNEYLQDKNLEELADIMEVLFALAAAHGNSVEELEAARRKKAEERGAFAKKLIIIYEK